MAQNPTRKSIAFSIASAMLVASCAVPGETTNPMSSAALAAKPLTEQQMDGVTAGLTISPQIPVFRLTATPTVTTIQPEASLRHWVQSGGAAHRN
jgi:hypothetical protein